MKKQQVAQKVQSVKGLVRGHSLSQDNVLLILLVLNVLAIIILALWSVTHIHATELSVPIRFTSFSNFDVLGKWYQLYELLGTSLLILVINTILAFVAHSSSRLLSAFLLLVSLFVTILNFAILIGFTAINFGGV